MAYIDEAREKAFNYLDCYSMRSGEDDNALTEFIRLATVEEHAKDLLRRINSGEDFTDVIADLREVIN